MFSRERRTANHCIYRTRNLLITRFIDGEVFHTHSCVRVWDCDSQGAEVIIIVDDRDLVMEGYESSFSREGIKAVGFAADDFGGWVESAAEEDVSAVDAFLLGSCEGRRSLASIIKRRSAAAIIAMDDTKSLGKTLDLFAAGVDDVVSKPCHVRELMARIGAISRRGDREDDALSVGDIEVFRDGRDPVVGGAPFPLPRRELRILEFLVVNKDRRVTKGQIFNSVYGLFDQDIDDNVIESHISKLRKRLRSLLGYDPIDSKRHLGYRLITQDALCEVG